MKQVLCLIAAIVCGIMSLSEAEAGSASAGIGEGCSYRTGSFTVPQGKVACNINASVESGWLPCAGTGHASRIGVRLKGPTGNVIYHYVIPYEGKGQVLAGNLAGLQLGPGTYTVEASDGGLGTTATVTYELMDAAPPPPAAGALGRPGGLSGDWTDPSVKSSARITQSGNSMTITNTFQWEGKTVTWTGSGTVSGDVVKFNYSYTGFKPEGWENGTMTLRRADKRTLSGSWTTASGKYTIPITFIQTRSDEPDAVPFQAEKPAAPKPEAGKAEAGHKAPAPTAQPPKKKIICPPGQIYEDTLGCTPYLREKEER